jgi:hypothetical protein
MLQRWREHREHRFGVYRKRSSVRLIFLLAVVVVILYYLGRVG